MKALLVALSSIMVLMAKGFVVAPSSKGAHVMFSVTGLPFIC